MIYIVTITIYDIWSTLWQQQYMIYIMTITTYDLHYDKNNIWSTLWQEQHMIYIMTRTTYDLHYDKNNIWSTLWQEQHMIYIMTRTAYMLLYSYVMTIKHLMYGMTTSALHNKERSDQHLHDKNIHFLCRCLVVGHIIETIDLILKSCPLCWANVLPGRTRLNFGINARRESKNKYRKYEKKGPN